MSQRTAAEEVPAEGGGGNEHERRVRVSEFDDSAENHFRAMDRISELCGEAAEAIDESEIWRLSSSITFLREWRLFNYEPRGVRFACEVGSVEGKEVVSGINLPQFSSATVPKKEGLVGEGESPEPRDFVIYAGGPVWGLDWCPRVSESSDSCSNSKCEFIAISAHPPGSSYHKIGAPVSGRGLVQIWCVLNIVASEEAAPPVEKTKRGRKSSAIEKEKPKQVKRPRGRPRKNPIKDHVSELDDNGQCFQPHDTQAQENSSNLLSIEVIHVREDSVQDGIGSKQVCNNQTESVCNLTLEATMQSNNVEEGNESNDTNQRLLSQCEHVRSGQDPGVSCDIIESSPGSIPNDVALPRVMLCLAHNGKVAWDVKWRPSNAHDSKCTHRMGFLAVLLGDGSLEVWEVPLPRTLKVLYSTLQGEGTDPRFVKLNPVFRCSMLKSGGVQSIPLTVEWSPSAPHELLLAGCHDGTVALWKFSASPSLKGFNALYHMATNTLNCIIKSSNCDFCSSSSPAARPLLCFSADTVPIRAIAWAPVESNSESQNVILTAGHGGLKFWDIRDPYCPLWDLQPALRIIYSLDWFPDPRCVILSFDDGTMRMLSLTKAVNDAPVTGKTFSGTKQQGLHSFCCSSHAIWSVQVSRPTGMVAYCAADGTVLRFQLTSKAVDKDPSRNRAPHFLCGSLTEDESTVTINTPVANTPFPTKKWVNRHGDTPTPLALRDVLSESNHLKSANTKSAKATASNDPPLAICYHDDSGVESEPDITIASLKRNKPPKSGSGNKKKAEDKRVLVPVNDEPSSSCMKENEKEKGGKFEVLPSKNIAMHRVRWNMNKGSERWLCSGGAAGIVRCQEIVLSDIDKKLAMKK